MKEKTGRQNSCRVLYGTIAVGNTIHYDVKTETNMIKNTELREVFDEMNRNTINEYHIFWTIKSQGTQTISLMDDILNFIYFTFDTEVINFKFIRYVHEKKYDLPTAFNVAMTEFLNSPSYMIPVELLCVKQEINSLVSELKSRLVARYHIVMFERFLRRIDSDFILTVNEFKKSYFYNLPKQVQGIICKRAKDEKLAFSFAREFELPLVIHNIEYQEHSRVIIDGIENQVIIDPSPEEEMERLQKIKKYTYCIGEDSSYTSSKINIYAPIVDIRNAEKIAYGNWYTGIAPFKPEFLYSAKGTILTKEEQYKLYHEMFTILKDKEIIIRIPDFRPERPVEALGEVFTDIETYDEYITIFQDNINAIANAARELGKEVKMVVPMIRVSSEILRWKQEIEAVFESCRIDNVKVGIMFETGSIYDFYEEYRSMDFVIIGLNDLIEEITDEYDRNSDLSKEEFLEVFWPDLRDIHQYFRSYLLQKKHIIAGNVLSNPEIFRKLLKSGFRDFSIRQSEIKLIEHVLTEHNETRGKYIGVAAERDANKEKWRINVILRDIRERKEKKEREIAKVLKKKQKEQQIRDLHKEKREQVIKELLADRKIEEKTEEKKKKNKNKGKKR